MSKVNLRRFSDGITQRIADEDQVELGCTVVQLSCGLFYKLLFH